MSTQSNEAGGSSDVYEYGDDFMLTTTVADAMNVVRMAFLTKVFAIIFLEYVCLTGASFAHLIFEDFQDFAQEFNWIAWAVIPLTLFFIICMSCVRTSSPLNLILLCLSILSISVSVLFLCGSLAGSVISGTIELFLFQQMITFGFLTLFCAIDKAEFSFIGSFLLGLIVSTVCVELAEFIIVHVSVPAAVIAAVAAVALEGYIFFNLYLQCKEVCPQAYDIAVVGIITHADVTVQYFFEDSRERKPTSLSDGAAKRRPYGSA